MQTTTNGVSRPSRTSTNSLKDNLEAALSSGLSGKVRYIRSLLKPTESLFSALPGQEPEKTRLASHFLTFSVDPRSLPQNEGSLPSDIGPDVIGFAIEVLVYTTNRLTTVFVSKVDSTPFIPRVKPSPIKTIVTEFLQWIAGEEIRKRPRRRVVISLFARAQAQYLFPGSSDDKTKHVLDDRQLIKWWARVLDPIMPEFAGKNSEDQQVKYQGYMTVPGYNGNELRTFMPSSTSNPPRWLPGYPLAQLAQTRGMPEHAPPRCLLPRFPDDPKARFMQELDDDVGLSQDSQIHVSPSKKKSGRWKSVQDLDRFWEAMEFRQECSSGRAVGFLWLVITPTGSDVEDPSSESFNVGSGESQESSASISVPSSNLPTSQPESSPRINTKPKKHRRKPLTGPIIPRQPRLKGGSSGLSQLSELELRVNAQAGDGIVVSKEGYERAVHTMLNLDFSNLQSAARSSSKWIAEVTSIAGLTHDFGINVVGAARAPASDLTSSVGDRPPAVNDLGGMVRKKRKAADPAVSEVQAAGQPGKDLVGGEKPAVNVLGGGTIRKKPKPAVS